MPYKRKYRTHKKRYGKSRFHRKNRYRSRYGRRKSKTHTFQNPSGALTRHNFPCPFPKYMKKNMRYCTRIHQVLPLGSSNANVATTTFRMNSLYDCEWAVGGSQPRWYKQMTEIYDKWIVLGSKITATPVAQSTATQVIKVWAYKTDILNKGTFVALDHMESGKMKMMQCTAGVVPGSTNQNGQTPITMTYSARKDHLMKIKDPWQEQYLWGSTATNPPDEFYVNLQCAPDNVGDVVTSAAITVTWDVTIDFKALFFDRKAVAAAEEVDDEGSTPEVVEAPNN